MKLSLEVVRCYTENTEGFSSGFSGCVGEECDTVPKSVTVGGGPAGDEGDDDDDG